MTWLLILQVLVFSNWGKAQHYMMTSSNGNIFRVTGHLCGEFTCVLEGPIDIKSALIQIIICGWVGNKPLITSTSDGQDLCHWPKYDITMPQWVYKVKICYCWFWTSENWMFREQLLTVKKWVLLPIHGLRLFTNNISIYKWCKSTLNRNEIRGTYEYVIIIFWKHFHS